MVSGLALIAGLRELALESAVRRLRDGLILTPNGCREWVGSRHADGYGMMFVGSRSDKSRRCVLTHRLVYELEKGPIPDGLELDHLCRNRLCANTQHLEAVTPGENIRRGNGRAGVNARKTECIHGHPFDATNTYVGPDGKRACRICKRNTWLRWKSRQGRLA